MTKQRAGGSRIAYLAAVAATFVWGLLGIADMPAATWTGYTTTPQNVVNRVQPGSPAEAAGLMVGDRIESIGGIPVTDSRGLNRSSRPLPGETRDLGTLRDGQAGTVALTYAGLPGGERALAWASLAIGLLFLFLPFLASRTGTDSGRHLGWFGVCFALTFMTGPWLTSPTARNVVTTIVLVAIVLGFALLLRFVLSFPQESAASEKPATRALVWGPATAIALMFAYILLAEPDATSTLNFVVSLLVGLFVIGYFGAALLVLLGKYRAASPDQRSASGLSLVVWGAVIALVPLLLSSIVVLVAPMVVLPGQQYYFLTFAAIPVTFSMAVIKSAPARVMAAAPA